MPAPAIVTEWLHAYGHAWEQRDEGVSRLFTEDATYRSNIFEDAHLYRRGIEAYWRRATSTQSDAVVRMGDPLVEGDRVVAEWWTTMTDSDDGEITLPGVLLLDFSGDLCSSLREYWAVSPGRREPFPGWGRLVPGSGGEHARAWGASYREAWEALDAHAAAALFSEDVSYRSHPFREATTGRGGAFEYALGAYETESGVRARFGNPVEVPPNAAIEYWATYEEEGLPVTLAGCAVMALTSDGTAKTYREYWHEREGTLTPPTEWGWA